MHFIEPSLFEIQYIYVLTFWRRSILTFAFVELDLQKVHFDPILTYNSEVWSAYTKSDLKYWDSYQIEIGEVILSITQISWCRSEKVTFWAT